MKRVCSILVLTALVLATSAFAGEEKLIVREYDLSKLRFTYVNPAVDAPELGVISDADDAPPVDTDPKVIEQKGDDTEIAWLTAAALKDEPKIAAEPVGLGQAKFRVTATEAQHQRIAKRIDDRALHQEIEISAEIRSFWLTAETEAALEQPLRDKLVKAREQHVGIELDDDDVSAMTTAVKEHVGDTSMVAPRLTIFSGQRAYVLVSSEQEFIADYHHDAHNAWVEVKKRLRTGTCLDLRVDLENDDTIAMQLHSQIATLKEMKKEQSKADPKLQIESPQLELWQIENTGTVRDRVSTLLFLPAKNALAKDSPTRAYIIVHLQKAG